MGKGGRQPQPSDVLPKGLSRESCDLVRRALREHGDMSATDCGQHTGMARVSVRRYLEYLVQVNEAEMRLQYVRGRPVELFRPAGSKGDRAVRFSGA